MRVNPGTWVVMVALAVWAAPARAHHSFAATYDASAPVTLKGTVTKVERVNPHGWIYIAVRNAAGTMEIWAIETAAAGQLARRGIPRNFPPIGTEIVVTGYRARDRSTTANAATLKGPDGKDLFVGSAEADAPRR